MFPLTTISLAAALALGGCIADDGAGDEGILLLKAVAVTGETCSFASNEGEMYIPHGTISMFSPNAYRMIPQMKSRVSADESNVDQRTIQVHGARVNLQFPDAAINSAVPANQKQFQSLFTAPLAPNGGITDGIIDLIPEGAIAAVRGAAGTERFETEVVAKVVIFGDLGGSEVTSQEFQFPVTICSDCIIGNIVGGTVPACPMTAAPRPGNPCNPFQDGVVDCCDSGDGIVCPGYLAQN